ncbi:transposase [Streptomyces yanii]|uniref:Transposase n=1 Tax=Streptomyces yanii TaxID=78510 RepID=A0ABV5R5L4_9ACTN
MTHRGSSGRTNRHRINRGGDRHANSALYTIVLVRMQHDQRTRDYVANAPPNLNTADPTGARSRR